MLGRNNAVGSAPRLGGQGACPDLLRSESGQSTLEYALVMFAFVASIAAMGVLVGFVQDARTYESVVATSAHVLSRQDAIGSAQDLAVF